jgi:hypothetical protein
MRPDDHTARPDLRSPGALCRAAADAELTPTERAHLDTLTTSEPDLAKCVQTEQHLKQCCARVMGAQSCPDALRARLRQIAAESRAAVDAHQLVGEAKADEAFARGVEARSEHTRSRSFWARVVLPMSMAAAAVALLAVSVSVLTGRGPGSAGPGAFAITNASFQSRVADFVTKEHRRCDDDKAAASKFTVEDPAAAVAEFEAMLGGRMTLPALDQPVGPQPVVFKGAGPCHVPGVDPARSVHMRFEIPADASGSPATEVSLFVVPAGPDNADLVEGTTYAVDAPACSKAGTRLIAWREGDLLYYLVADTAANGCAKLLGAMNRPEPKSSI